MRALIGVLALAACVSAKAETVMVRYVGPVDLSGMGCGFMESSFVHRICYHRTEQRAVALLGNTYYQFCNLPPQMMGAWINSPSLGRFFNANIKDGYACRR